MASWQTVSDLLGPDAAYPGRNFYQQQHANGPEADETDHGVQHIMI